MIDSDSPYGMTVQVQVGDVDEARRFYSTLLGREPGFEPHDDFLEWSVVDGGETWVQVVEVAEVRPLMNHIRFGVRDLPAQRARLEENGVRAGPITTLPGVVAFFDFQDPWGNHLGCYEDIAPSGRQPVVGGSVHDETLFVTDGHPAG